MSFKTILSGVSKESIASYLEDNADGIQEGYTYTRRLTEEELQALADEMGENAVKLMILEEKKRDFLDELKLETQPLQGRNKEITMSIRTKTEEVTGTVYEFRDHENGVVETFGADGEFLASRRMRPDEGQGTIYSMRRRSGTFDE